MLLNYEVRDNATASTPVHGATTTAVSPAVSPGVCATTANVPTTHATDGPPPQQQQQQQQSVVVVNNSAPAPVPSQTVVVQRPRVNHFLHLIITILFLPWVIVWFILCITEGDFGITPA